jgi:hypothetical protein
MPIRIALDIPPAPALNQERFTNAAKVENGSGANATTWSVASAHRQRKPMS